MMRLEHGGVEVRDRCARRRDEKYRMLRFDGKPESEKARDALVDAHSEADLQAEIPPSEPPDLQKQTRREPAPEYKEIV